MKDDFGRIKKGIRKRILEKLSIDNRLNATSFINELNDERLKDNRGKVGFCFFFGREVMRLLYIMLIIGNIMKPA
ncbi:MAG TPA: hypothetical protein VE978_20675 [Chitinophagales bacterium]|nr:hypothetical protein [Chitinophagales bacterium]